MADGPNLALPVLPVWQARSFWLTIIAASTSLGAVFGINPLTAAGFADPGAAADAIMQIVTGVSVILAFGQRMAPNFRLGL
jgi:hypothetical protein